MIPVATPVSTCLLLSIFISAISDAIMLDGILKCFPDKIYNLQNYQHYHILHLTYDALDTTGP